MSYDQNTPINTVDVPITSAIEVPKYVDRTDIAYPINVINSLDRRVLGEAMYFRGKITQFKRSKGDFRVQPHLTLGITAADLVPRMDITVDGEISDRLVVSAQPKSGEYIFDFPSDTSVTWTVRLTLQGNVLVDETFTDGTMMNQFLFELELWYGRVRITAQMDEIFGELIIDRNNPRHISDLTPTQALGGLLLPEWAINM